jgi:signal transduction histidine kinase
MRGLYKASSGSFYLLDDLLHWANSQRNALTLHPDYYPLCESAGRVINLLRFQYQEKSIEVRNDCVRYITAFFDKSSLEIVIRNLVSNAIKFSHPGGQIVIEGRLGNDFAYLSIKDQGVGMPAEILDKLHRDEIVQSQVGTANEVGTGFGIQMCRALMKANHGELTIMSTPGEGTTVTLSIPLRVVT